MAETAKESLIFLLKTIGSELELPSNAPKFLKGVEKFFNESNAKKLDVLGDEIISDYLSTFNKKTSTLLTADDIIALFFMSYMYIISKLTEPLKHQRTEMGKIVLKTVAENVKKHISIILKASSEDIMELHEKAVIRVEKLTDPACVKHFDDVFVDLEDVWGSEDESELSDTDFTDYNSDDYTDDISDNSDLSMSEDSEDEEYVQRRKESKKKPKVKKEKESYCVNLFKNANNNNM